MVDKEKPKGKNKVTKARKPNVKKKEVAVETPVEEVKEEAEAVAEPVVKHFAFIARYDNIALANVTLNNLKCVIYECDATDIDEAFKIFRAKLAPSVAGQGEVAVDKLLANVFGTRIIVECSNAKEVQTININL